LQLPLDITYGRDIAIGIATYARSHGRWSFVRGAGSSGTLPIPWIEDLRQDGIIGLIYGPDVRDKYLSLGVPVVNCSGRLVDVDVPSVLPDDDAIGRMAAGHFIDLGYRTFGYVGVRGFGFSVRRGAGFRSALVEAGLEGHLHESAIDYAPGWSYEGQQTGLTEWAKSLPKPVAIFAPNDQVASHASDACRRAGVMIPEDAILLGVDNDVPVCEFSDPPLSSIDSNIQVVGYRAAAMLDRLMRGEMVEPLVEVVPPRGIVARRSSDAMALDDKEVAAAVRFIRENAHRDIDVETILNEVPINRRSLERRFRRSLGRTPAAEIRRCRIELAKKLLAETDKSMSEIARSSGFLYPQHLASAFLQITGMTPSDYRHRAGSTPKPASITVKLS
jgi:LacI family transcriptional regulator